MYLVAVIYPSGSLTTIVSSRSEAIQFIWRMKERLKKASETNVKGYVFPMLEAVEVVS